MGEVRFKEMIEVSPVTITIWFWLFVVVVVMILMKLLQAIFIVAYAELVEKLGQTRGQNMWSQSQEAVKSICTSMVRRTADVDDVLAAVGVSAKGTRGTIIAQTEETKIHGINDLSKTLVLRIFIFT